MAALDSVIANNTEALAAELLAAPAEIFYAMHVDCLHHPSVVEALDIDSLVESVSLLGLAGLTVSGGSGVSGVSGGSGDRFRRLQNYPIFYR